MARTVAETIRETTRRHLTENKGLLFGQCVTAVGWIGGTVPEMTEKEGIPFTEKLLEAPEVKPIGLGARDSLRLEAGLCLYGHELTEDITPVEGGISWSVGKRRRKDGGFLGVDKIMAQLTQGPTRRRIGFTLQPGSIAREGAEIKSSPEGNPIGHVTSGGHSPTLGYPIGMGYVEVAESSVGGEVLIEIRGQERVAKVVKLPFVPHTYFKN
jgi:aminomethyltransferase